MKNPSIYIYIVLVAIGRNICRRVKSSFVRILYYSFSYKLDAYVDIYLLFTRVLFRRCCIHAAFIESHYKDSYLVIISEMNDRCVFFLEIKH